MLGFSCALLYMLFERLLRSSLAPFELIQCDGLLPRHGTRNWKHVLRTHTHRARPVWKSERKGDGVLQVFVVLVVFGLSLACTGTHIFITTCTATRMVGVHSMDTLLFFLFLFRFFYFVCWLARTHTHKHTRTHTSAQHTA